MNPQILRYVSSTAEQICLSRHGRGHGRTVSVDDVAKAMIEAARAGKTVVRLKSGDPVIFARAAEELGALRDAGVPFVLVPGITAGFAAGSYAELPLTDRDVASCVALVVGHRRSDGAPPDLDYDALARFPGTLIVYMGVTTVEVWSRELLAAGKPANTPVAVVRRCSFPDQSTHVCRLGEVTELIVQANIRPPAVVIVGQAAGRVESTTWFTRRPLYGQTVLVTWPTGGPVGGPMVGLTGGPGGLAEALSDQLSELGARLLHQPVVEIGPPDNWTPVDRAIAAIDTFDWLVFLSAIGVHFFLQRLRERDRDLRALGGLRIAAIGTATVTALDAAGLRADLFPSEHGSEALAAALAPHAQGQRFLVARASRGRELLAEQLIAAGAVVEPVVVCTSRDVAAADVEIDETISAGAIDWTTVTSSAIARSLVALFGDSLKKTRLAAISPLTASVLVELGYRAAVVATESTSDGIVDAILHARLPVVDHADANLYHV